MKGLKASGLRALSAITLLLKFLSRKGAAAAAATRGTLRLRRRRCIFQADAMGKERCLLEGAERRARISLTNWDKAFCL